jgi:iron(III) transport system permease protein
VSSTEFRTDRIRSITRSSLGIALWVVFCGVLAVVFVYPVFMVVFGAVHGDALPSWTEPLDFTGFVATFTSAATFKTLGNSLILVVACGSVATILGALFAWIGANTNVPLRRMLTPAMVIMLFLPPLFYTFGWEMLANVQNGLFNQILHSWGLPRGVLNIETWAGLIFTLSLGFTPFTYMLMIGAFANRDQALDEAAQISGSGVFRTFFTVTIPSVGPAIVGAATLVFILIFQAFDSPQILGRPAGITVFSTEIYHDVQGVVPGAYSTAFSLALVMIAIVVILFVGQRLLLRGRSFTTLTGKSARRGTQQLGRVRGVFTAVIVLFIILNLVLPLGAVILGSLEPIFGVLGALTFDNYVQVFTDPRLTSSLVLTVQFAIIGGLIAMAVAVLTSYVVIRRSGFLRGFTSFALWIPWAVPGVVTALCVRLSEGALVQLSPELEQAGRVAGAGAARVFFTIVLRLLVPSFLAGWFLSALFITGNLSVPILLAPPGFEPVSIAAFHLFLDGNTAAGAALFVVILAGAAVVLAVAGIVLAVLRRVKARQATQISVAPESQGVPAVPIT